MVVSGYARPPKFYFFYPSVQFFLFNLKFCMMVGCFFISDLFKFLDGLIFSPEAAGSGTGEQGKRVNVTRSLLVSGSGDRRSKRVQLPATPYTLAVVFLLPCVKQPVARLYPIN